jgi:glycosyltransferase involved in cell wall biosynthesis
MAARQLRVAFVDYMLDPARPGRSGLSDVVWDMASELVNQGHEAHVIASYHTDTYPDNRVVVHNFPTPPIGYRNVVGHFLILKRAADIARRLRPDVIHAPEYVSTAVLATLRVPMPLVFTVPGNVYHRIRYGHSYEWYYLQILKWAARVSASRCAAVVAVSQEMKRWWEWTGSPSERTYWIPYGVDPSRFHLVPGARQQLGIPEECLVLLYVGRFSQEKGLLDLLRALSIARAHADVANVRVVLIGKGPQSDDLLRVIDREALGQIVQIRPWVAQNELSMWYSAVDALLLPSHTEAFARVILEAMSCGTPVIGTRITGTEDHIQENVNGFLFTRGDVGVLSEILERVIRQPQLLRCLRYTTAQYVSEQLTWQRIVERIVVQVYMPLVGAGAYAPPGQEAPAL